LSTEEYLYCNECRCITLHNALVADCTVCHDLDKPLTKRTLIDFLKDNLSIQADKDFGYGDDRDSVRIIILLSNEIISSDRFYT